MKGDLFAYLRISKKHILENIFRKFEVDTASSFGYIGVFVRNMIFFVRLPFC